MRNVVVSNVSSTGPKNNAVLFLLHDTKPRFAVVTQHIQAQTGRAWAAG